MKKKPEPVELVDFAILSRKYKTTLTKKYINRKVWEDPNPNLLTSYIPGTIVDIMVAEGQIVEEGQEIMILESMKMLNKIQMPWKARVLKINVTKGDKIPKNFVMFELEDIIE